MRKMQTCYVAGVGEEKDVPARFFSSNVRGYFDASVGAGEEAESAWAGNGDVVGSLKEKEAQSQDVILRSFS